MKSNTTYSLPDPRSVKKKATRDGYGEALIELGASNRNVWVLTGDLGESMRCTDFAAQYPDRFLDVGVAEQNLMGVAAGLALTGKVPFVSSFAVFSPGRNWDQLRVSVCYSRANVKIAGGHAGLLTGPDGATHQALEDIAITRVLPHMTVVVPCDALQAKQATLALATINGPAYIRLTREPMPQLVTHNMPFDLGHIQILRDGHDVTLIGTGPVLYEALKASDMLATMGIDAAVLNLHTIKPIDTSTLVKYARETGAFVTIEDHQIHGGMGSAVAECIVEQFPVPIEFVGVHDSFGQSGTAQNLYEYYGLTAQQIVIAAKKSLTRKNKRNFVQ